MRVRTLWVCTIFAVLFSLALPISYFVATAAPASSTNVSSVPFTPVTLARVPGTAIVYVLGDVKCGSKECARLSRTSDNGNAFTAATPPPLTTAAQIQNENSYELVFANRRVGFADVGLISPSAFYVTVNGAKTWHKEKVPYGNRILGFATTSKIVYVVTADFDKKLNAGDGGNTDYRLDRSSLTSFHWSSTPIPNSNDSWGFLGPMAASGDNVWISEQRHDDLLVRSTDSGKTLSTVVLHSPTLASVAGCALTATSSVTLWAQCPTGLEDSFYYSDDGGTRWTLIDPVSQISGTGGAYFDPVSSDLGFLDAGLPHNDVYRITNDAHDATLIGTLRCNGANCFVFTNEVDGLAISETNTSPSSRLVRTTDGGSKWTRVTSL